MKPLAVTGVGAVTPVGLGIEALERAFRDVDVAAVRAFAGEPTVLSPDKFPEAHTAEVWGFDAKEQLGPKGHRNFDRLTKYLIVAAKDALEDAGAKANREWIGALKPEQVGICSSTAYGSLDSITELNLVAELEDPRYINPARFPNTVINAAAGYVSIWEDLRAPNATIVDGNCGAIDAVLSCETHLAHRRADAFLVGGGDVLTEPLYLAFRRLGAIAAGDARWAPGEETSQGLHLGECAAYLMVERVADAAARGARVRAHIAGYGTAFDAPKLEARLLHVSSAAIARAIRGALNDAGMSRDDIDVVASSLGGLRPFDRAELEGIEAALGDVAVAAPKAIWGEGFSGSAALSMASAVTWLEGATPGPLVRGEVEAVHGVVVLAVGYYGNVSATVLRRA
ncbi:MAG: beta-ketoacyl synthase N-terminal-like domain-containing protein [Sandaracinaceae bacterium]